MKHAGALWHSKFWAVRQEGRKSRQRRSGLNTRGANLTAREACVEIVDILLGNLLLRTATRRDIRVLSRVQPDVPGRGKSIAYQ